jgi:maltose alpha-D-glucosyltransferase/alpha-amylase
MPVDAWLEGDLPRLLPAFLPHQRWFAGKARRIAGVDIEDAAPLAASPSDVAFVVAAVRYADGSSERYGMLIGAGSRDVCPPGAAAIGQLGPTASAFEAAGEPGAVRALLAGFAGRRTIAMQHGGTLVYGDTAATTDALVARIVQRGVVKPIGAEQSNTSLRLVPSETGGAEAREQGLVFKLIRRLEAGENPDVEVGRFLTNHTTFRAMAALRGSLTYVAASGESSTAGILQDWIESRSDGWAYVVPLLRQARGATSADLLTRDVLRLGAVTADLHLALAAATPDAAFAPEPVTAADVHAWHASVLDRIARTFRLLEEQLTRLTPEARPPAEALIERQAALESAVKVPELTGSGRFQKIRIHGDYHLGQVLRTADGFAVIDFEGEPARPLAERRLKSAALKDVAGMIRSIDYAGGAACADETAAPDEPFARRLRETFIDGYLESANAHEAAFLPRDREAVDAWVAFFELEKALYEVEYEVNNRPGWAHIPLRGMLRILRREPEP